MDQITDHLPAARLDPDARLWAAFAAAESTDAMCRGWLALQCRNLPGVDAAMLLLARNGGAFQPVAMWPDAGQDLSFLRSIAEECVRTASPVVHRPPHADGATGLHVAYPFLADGDQPAGAVVLDLRPRTEADLQTDLRSLHWGVGWLEAQAVRDRMSRERQRVAGAAAALDIVAVANEHDRLEAAAMAVANELAMRLQATRVAIGLETGRGVRLLALSHTAWFRRKTAMVGAIEQAMEEAAEQRATVRLPAPSGEAVRIQVAHEALRAIWEADGAYTTLPLVTDRGAIGAITILHPDMAGDAVVRLGEAISALLGPILDQKRRARRLVSGRVVDAAEDVAAAIIGPRHLAWKLAAGLVAAGIAAAILVPTKFRVSAKAVLEGQVQLAAVAPFEGFIASAPAKAGDVVHAGDVLATLDDRDLQLERVRWQSERERLVLKSREAMAKHDPGTSAQLDAQRRQTEAQAALTAEKLARTRILSPIDGIVVSGDLSQSIGAPVETGKALFEVAPLDDYRVMVRMDERDIRYVQPGPDAVRILLHGMTGETCALHRAAALPPSPRRRAATTPSGSKGALDGALDQLCGPGMEGVGKDRGRQSLTSVACIWTRSLVDWAADARHGRGLP